MRATSFYLLSGLALLAVACSPPVRTEAPAPPTVTLPDPGPPGAPTVPRTQSGELTFFSFVGGYAGEAPDAPWGFRSVDLSLRQTGVARIEFWPREARVPIRIETGAWQFRPGLVTVEIDRVDGSPGVLLYRFRTSDDGLTLDGGRRTEGAIAFDFRLVRVR